MQTNILIVSDNKTRNTELEQLLNNLNVQVHKTCSIWNTPSLIEEKGIKIVICDFDFDSNEKLIMLIKVQYPLCCIIAVTEKPNMAKFIAAIDVGVWDYIVNPTANHQLFHDCINSAILRVDRWVNYRMISKRSIKNSIQSSEKKDKIQIDLNLLNVHSDPDVLSHFLDETQNSLLDAISQISLLKTYPEDISLIDHLLQLIISLKDNAYHFELLKIRQLSFEIKKVLEQARDGYIIIDLEISELLYDGFQCLIEMVKNLQNGLSEVEEIHNFTFLKEKMMQVSKNIEELCLSV